VAAPAALLLDELHGADAHAALVALQHVVDGEAGGRDRGQGLHLHAGPVDGAHRGGHLDAGGTGPRLHLHPREGDGVAERDDVRRPLGRHDPGEPRRGDDVPLLGLAAAHDADRGRPHRDEATRHRHPLGLGLRADVDHLHD